MQMKEDLIFFCDKMDKKINTVELHKDLEEIKNEQKLIVNTISVTNLLLLQNSQQALRPAKEDQINLGDDQNELDAKNSTAEWR